MLRGELLALMLTAVFAALVVCERIPRVRALGAWPVLRELLPVLSVVAAAQCAAHWFTSVSEIRPPKFLPCLAASFALALPTAAVKNARVRRVVAGLCVFIVSFLALADALYFRFFGGIVPLLGTANAKQAWAVTSSIAALFMVRDFAFVPLLGAGVWLFASRPDPAQPAAPRPRNAAFGGALALSVACVLLVGFDTRSWLSEVHSVKIFSWKQRLHQTGVFGAHVRDVARMARAARQAGEPPSAEKVREIARYLESTGTSVPDEFFGVARGKNLVMLQIEALQEWVIGTRVRNQEITPFLNRLRRERALYFSGVWDQTAISPTADSEFLTLNSLHPMPDAAVVFKFAGNDFVALPGVLVRQGYSTFSAHAFERGFWNRAAVHPRYGFQQSFFDRELGSEPKIGWGLSDKVFLQRALGRADRARAPFMAFFVTLTSHHPYQYVPAAERHIDTTGLPDIVAGYVASMRYVDEALSDFFAALASRPYGKDTVVVIYGDHESRIPLDKAAAARTQSLLSLDEQTMKDVAVRSWATRKIPLFIVLPDAKEPRTFERVGGQIDISPTLLHLFGLPKPKSMIGHPLLGTGGAVFRADGAAVEGGRMRLPDGNCRALKGVGLPRSECDALGVRADVELNASWTITQYNLAERLSGDRSASR